MRRSNGSIRQSQKSRCNVDCKRAEQDGEKKEEKIKERNYIKNGGKTEIEWQMKYLSEVYCFLRSRLPSEKQSTWDFIPVSLL